MACAVVVRAAGAPPAKFLPPAGKTLSIVGQDWFAVADYVAQCKDCPPPGGVTTYLGFYDLLSKDANFGGLGQDAAGNPAADADWGGGLANAARMAAAYPQSALALGLDISEERRAGGLAELKLGMHDDKILRLARFCRQVKQPIFLRVGYEFDGAWNMGYADRAAYVAAYRRIVDTLRAQGVTNVAFVWQASASPVDEVIEGGRREMLRDWYPGSTYVDWMALSWFLRPEEKSAKGVERMNQLQLADELLALARAERKPVMIAEASPQGYDLKALSNANISPLWDGAAGADVVARTPQQIWLEWYQPIFSYMDANRDLIRAFAYINVRWDDQPMWGPPYAKGYWGDTRIQANPDIQRRWLDEMHRPAWAHGGAKLTESLK